MKLGIFVLVLLVNSFSIYLINFLIVLFRVKLNCRLLLIKLALA